MKATPHRTGRNMQKTHPMTEYLKNITGTVPEISVLTDSTLKKIPFFLRDHYTLQIVTLMGHSFVVATEKNQITVKPSQFIAHADLLRKTLDTDIAFAFTTLPAYLRQRFVQNGIAFIVPGTQMFLPFMMMDFRSRTRNAVNVAGDAEGRISMPGQMVLLYHLQCEPIENRTLGQLSKQFNYSAMTLSRVLAELAKRGICETHKDGVRKYPKFVASGHDLWEKALPYLQTPITAIETARIDENNIKRFPHAGITALSDYTMLADDPSLTVAIASSDWQRSLKDGSITKLPDQDE